jgi:hypothetical protein
MSGCKRKILMERADIVDCRSRYLVKIKEYRDKGHPIFYIDESWVDSSLTFRKSWQNEKVMGVQANVNSVNMLIMLHVAGINGFLPNAALIYKAGSATRDYHDKMNAAHFEKWTVEKLIPNLPAQSVTALGNTPSAEPLTLPTSCRPFKSQDKSRELYLPL